MTDQTTVPHDSEQAQEEAGAVQPADTGRLSLHDLRAQIPSLAVLAVGFFATFPLTSPDGMRGPHNG